MIPFNRLLVVVQGFMDEVMVEQRVVMEAIELRPGPVSQVPQLLDVELDVGRG